ncbi:CatB-related O-acetyltransferase [Desulfoscipio gibsoniae]|uniref:Acetyltransferase (Isoleucine patch superfamily) n=1 Tax=Desulfoscipio gibsoniae DSM 7213 TaxID=767817 RepID=R4KHS7_9FIRM|nr:CatB-related O-acetyltransferase [Desulfoscipio gibsoniae]AGL02768.1 hypothetical protein Desgi_3425 [Desulfoscipio gibsoniae DSM 7213]
MAIITVGEHSLSASFNPFITTPLPSEVIKIGKFSGLASGVKVFSGMEHYSNNVAGYPLSILYFHKIEGLIKDCYSNGPTIIGNDVLVMYNSVIMSGVTIGDGAFIGAGSVVRKDVPPYAIAFGNPARIAGYRFSEEQIKALLRIRWWDWSDKEIHEFEEYFYDIDTFITKAMEKMEKEGRL